MYSLLLIKNLEQRSPAEIAREHKITLAARAGTGNGLARERLSDHDVHVSIHVVSSPKPTPPEPK